MECTQKGNSLVRQLLHIQLSVLVEFWSLCVFKQASQHHCIQALACVSLLDVLGMPLKSLLQQIENGNCRLPGSL